MRTAFIRAFCEQARQDPSLWLLCGDIGYSVLEVFAQEFPDRFVNVGVAEQNMVGVAAGLAMSGKNVFTYTIGNFAFMRCLEQIRNDVCYHNHNVKVVAPGGGFAYGAMGYTHHVIEDIAMMRVLPNLTLFAPGDPVETTLATQALCKQRGPGYMRLGRGGEPVIHATAPAFTPGKAIIMREGRDATIVTSAGTLDLAAQAAGDLEKSGLSVGLISMPSLIPFDREGLLAAASRTKRLVTIEEHGNGGLGTLVAECLTEHGAATVLRRIFVQNPLSAKSGEKGWLRELHGITAAAIVKAATS